MGGCVKGVGKEKEMGTWFCMYSEKGYFVFFFKIYVYTNVIFYLRPIQGPPKYV